MTNLRTRGTAIKVAAWALVAIVIGTGSTANAAGRVILLDSGVDFFVVQDCVGCNVGPDGVGAVISLFEIVDLPGSTRVFAVETTILDILVFEEGWTYQVKKDGGIDAAVEVIFESPTCFVKYKSKVEPGRTKVDHGAVRCK